MGVDRFAACISRIEPLRIVVIGLQDTLSVKSARHLAQTTYCDVIDQISLNDHRDPEAQLNLLIHSRPDLVIAAGGTNRLGRQVQSWDCWKPLDWPVTCFLRKTSLQFYSLAMKRSVRMFDPCWKALRV